MINSKSKVLHATLIILACIGATSCEYDPAQNTIEVATERKEQKIDKTDEKDAQFLIDAAEINREEISLGRLAQQKGNMSHVRELGKMMEDEHSKSWATVTTLAKEKNISLPTSQTVYGLAAYVKLNEKSGNDFGKEYSDMMVSGHKDAIALFEKAAINCTDTDIKSWAIVTLPTLKMHLDYALMCQKECVKIQTSLNKK